MELKAALRAIRGGGTYDHKVFIMCSHADKLPETFASLLGHKEIDLSFREITKEDLQKLTKALSVPFAVCSLTPGNHAHNVLFFCVFW